MNGDYSSAHPPTGIAQTRSFCSFSWTWRVVPSKVHPSGRICLSPQRTTVPFSATAHDCLRSQTSQRSTAVALSSASGLVKIVSSFVSPSTTSNDEDDVQAFSRGFCGSSTKIVSVAGLFSLSGIGLLRFLGRKRSTSPHSPSCSSELDIFYWFRRGSAWARQTLSSHGGR